MCNRNRLLGGAAGPLTRQGALHERASRNSWASGGATRIQRLLSSARISSLGAAASPGSSGIQAWGLPLSTDLPQRPGPSQPRVAEHGVQAADERSTGRSGDGLMVGDEWVICGRHNVPSKAGVQFGRGRGKALPLAQICFVAPLGGAAEIAHGFSGVGAIHVSRGEARIASAS